MDKLLIAWGMLVVLWMATTVAILNPEKPEPMPQYTVTKVPMQATFVADASMVNHTKTIRCDFVKHTCIAIK